MPLRRTCFNNSWLASGTKDRNGDFVTDWCVNVKLDVYSAHCKICRKNFSISNMGLGQVLSHAESAKHVSLVTNLKGQTKFRVEKNPCTQTLESGTVSEPSTSSTTSTTEAAHSTTADVVLVSPALKSGKGWIPLTLDEKVKKAEILLVMKLTASNYSFNSYADISDICKIAFADSDIAQHMKLGSTKASYLIVHGLAPYFQSYFLRDMRAGIGYYTLYFDETTTRQVKKQMDIHVAYWSPLFNRVIGLYLDSKFLGHADAVTVKSVIEEFLEEKNLDPHKLLQCSMDGPAVNLSFLKKFNESLLSKGILPVIDIGTCSLHPVHTSFTKGLSKLSFDVDQFSNDIFFWFKLSAGRREDYAEVQIEELMEQSGQYFVRPVSSRWLSLGPVCERLIEQYPAMTTYFLKAFPGKTINKAACAGDRYKRIRAALEDESTIVYLNFVAFLASNMTEFIKLFQRSEPLVHILYDKLNELIRRMMYKFLKSDVVKDKEGEDVVAIDCNDGNNWLPLKEMDIGMATRLAVSKVKKDKTRQELRLSFRQCLKQIATYMQTALPVQNPVLRDLRCLQPSARKLEETKSTVFRLCQHLKKITRMNDMCDRVQAEWLMYMFDHSLDPAHTEYEKSGNICQYWVTVSEVPDGMGGKKYVNVAHVAKAALTLSHSNAIPERGFSVNNALLGKDSLSLSEKTIVAERTVKDAIRIFGGVTAVPVNKDMIDGARKAHSEYQLFLDKQRKQDAVALQQKIDLEKQQEEVQDRQKKMNTNLALLRQEDQLEKEQMNELEAAKELINEASDKMSAAIDAKNMQSVKVAQMMLKTGNEKLQLVSKTLEAVRNNQKKLRDNLGKGCTVDAPVCKKKKMV